MNRTVATLLVEAMFTRRDSNGTVQPIKAKGSKQMVQS
jgi:hypothetical protein